VGFIDALDNLLTNAKGRRLAARDEEQFVHQLRKGQIWWSIRSNGARPDRPWITPFTLETWEFKPTGVLGIWMAGGVPATSAWRLYGPLYPERPTIEILTAQEQHSLPDDSGERYQKAREKLRRDLARQYPHASRQPLEVKA